MIDLRNICLHNLIYVYIYIIIFQEARVFCPHHVGHYLGMDVHDTATISRGIKFQPGMVITVEPGKETQQHIY